VTKFKIKHQVRHGDDDISAFDVFLTKEELNFRIKLLQFSKAKIATLDLGVKKRKLFFDNFLLTNF